MSKNLFSLQISQDDFIYIYIPLTSFQFVIGISFSIVAISYVSCRVIFFVSCQMISWKKFPHDFVLSVIFRLDNETVIKAVFIFCYVFLSAIYHEKEIVFNFYLLSYFQHFLRVSNIKSISESWNLCGKRKEFLRYKVMPKSPDMCQ